MKLLPSIGPKPTTFVFDVSILDASVRKAFEKQVSRPGGQLWNDQVGVDPTGPEKDIVFLSTTKKRHARRIANNFEIGFFSTKEPMKDVNLFVSFMEKGRDQVEFLKNAVVNVARQNHNHLGARGFYKRFTEFANQMYTLLGVNNCGNKAAG